MSVDRDAVERILSADTSAAIWSADDDDQGRSDGSDLMHSVPTDIGPPDLPGAKCVPACARCVKAGKCDKPASKSVIRIRPAKSRAQISAEQYELPESAVAFIESHVNGRFTVNYKSGPQEKLFVKWLGKPGIQINGRSYIYAKLIGGDTDKARYAEAVRLSDDENLSVECRSDGTARQFVLKLPPHAYSKAAPTVIHEGNIRVTDRYDTYEPNAELTLTRLENSDYVRITHVNRAGYSHDTTIPAMQFMKSAGQQPEWTDKLGLLGAGNWAPIRDYIKAQFDDHDWQLLIQGQGPMYLPDSDGMIFVAKSGVVNMDTGEPEPSITVDLPSSSGNYYDVSPLTRDKTGVIVDRQGVKAGIRELNLGLLETPGHPEIAAALTGQLFTSPVASVMREFFSAILLSGERGSGKTRLAARYDAVQSRTMRNTRNIRPALNLGDTTGTAKGAKYKLKQFNGFTVTVDDVIKSGMTPFQIKTQTESVSALIRSFESGGSALGHVNRVKNKVESVDAPALHSSIRLTSESPLAEPSLMDRMIAPPHLTASWGKGGIFNMAASKKLNEKSSLDAQHKAWSAYVYWMLPQRNSMLSDYLSAAREVTSGLDVSARIADRYAVVIAGLKAFERFAAEYGINVSENVTAGITALCACAERQSAQSVPVGESFRETVRALIAEGKASFPGPPTLDPNGLENQSYSYPWVMREVELNDGTTEKRVEAPAGIDAAELGLSIFDGKFLPRNANAVYGYLIPPRADKGGKTGSEYRKRWLIAIRVEQFKALCKAVSKDARQYATGDVLNSIQQLERGDKIQIALPKLVSAVIIDAEWLLGEKIETEEH